MSDFCSPLPRCDGLDGRLLLRRAVYGPQLVFDPGPVPFPGLTAQGTSLRPYLDLFFTVRWVSKGVCYGPVSSIMGLAPGERVTVGLRTRRTQTFTSLFRSAIESSSVATHTRTRATERIDVEPDAPGSGGGAGLGIFDDVIEDLVDSLDDVLEISPIFAAAFGSLFQDALGVGGAIVGGAFGGPVGAALGGAAGSAIGDLIDGALDGGGGGGGGPVLVDTTRRLDEIVDSIERRESQSQVRQTSVSTTSETEQTITRSFSNPYRDRALELRFVPAYHRFDVVTGIQLARVGLAAVLAEPARTRPAGATLLATRALAARAASDVSVVAARPYPGPATPVAAALHVAQAQRDEGSLRAPVLQLLRGRGAVGERDASVDRGLAWSSAEARGSAVHVPIAEPRTAAKAWGLKGAEAGRFVKAVERIDPSKVQLLIPKPIVRPVHVYAGTHVEAVPGECLLPDIPDELRIIVCCDEASSATT